jgi:two-component system, sensor histidine kinase and response regulator
MKNHLNILYLEDSSLDAELVKSALESEDIACIIVRVETREDFVSALDRGGYDIIFADYSLPSFDGLSALEIAKKSSPDIPFIFVSGSMGEELAIDTLKSGATDYVIKGRLSRLAPSVRRALAEFQERSRLRFAEEELTEYRIRLEEMVKERTAELQAANRELEASYKDLESFSYSASHDLREPLLVIDWFSTRLMKQYGRKLDENGRELLFTIQDTCGKMNKLIEDLLSFARISSKGVLKTKIDMKELAYVVFEEMRSMTEDREVNLLIGELPAAWGDASMIRQVFANLLSNAIKYTRPVKSANIEVGYQKERNECCYYVRDNGIGFKKEHAHNLFGLFQRLHAAESIGGTGIGLAIAKRIIEKHGGRIWAESKVEEGATFHFSLPISGRTVGRNHKN